MVELCNDEEAGIANIQYHVRPQTSNLRSCKCPDSSLMPSSVFQVAAVQVVLCHCLSATLR